MIKPFSTPYVSTSLLLHTILNRRKDLSSLERQTYSSLYKGFYGEQILVRLLDEHMPLHLVPLYGLHFTVDGQEVQLDCLLIYSDGLYLLEVKNYSGNYTIKDDKICLLQTGVEIRNPFLQLERSTFLLTKLFLQLQIDIKVRPYVVFVNDAFTLYNAPTHLPIIFPTQLTYFFNKVNTNSKISPKQTHLITQKLISHHQDKSLYERLPTYRYDDLPMGLFCVICHKLLKRRGRVSFACHHCNLLVNLHDAILDAVAEYDVLFPERKITVQKIFH